MPELLPPTTAPMPVALPAALPADRREVRRQVEMLARFRRDLESVTVVLKDLTPLGARIEGIGPIEADAVVTLALPECRPMIAFIAWANAHGAGVEFVEPLPDDLFAQLVAQYGLSSEAPIGG